MVQHPKEVRLQDQLVKPFRYVVKFQPIIDGNGLPILSKEAILDLSKNQQNMYNIILAIRVGILPKDLAMKKPGPVNHSRSLTLANQGCRQLDRMKI